MCMVFSIIEHVYWYMRVILSSMFVVESSYVSFLRSSFLCIHIVIFLWEWDEWPSPKGSRSLSFPSLHSLLMWLHSMFDLSWSSLFFIYSLFCYHPHHCLWFILFASPPCSFLHWPIPSLIFPLHHSCISHYQFDLPHCLIIDIIFTLGTLRSMTRELFYACYSLYMRAWFFIIEYLGLISFHFYYLITLDYITSCVLRPPWGHGIRCRLQQPLLRLHLRLGWCLDIIMLLLLGNASLTFGPDLVVDMDDWDCTFDDGWSNVVRFFDLPYIWCCTGAYFHFDWDL